MPRSLLNRLAVYAMGTLVTFNAHSAETPCAETLSALNASLKPKDFNEKVFLDLCEKLFHANVFFRRESIQKDGVIEFVSVEEKISCREAIRRTGGTGPLQPLSNTKSGYLSILMGSQRELNIVFNGQVMFLGASYLNRDIREVANVALTEWSFKKGTVIRDFGVRLHADGTTTILDQNKVFLQSLPESVPVSRCMSPWEINHWSKGTLDMDEFRGDRIHFGYGNFSFDQGTCMSYVLPRRILENLDSQNLLEINTYEFSAHAQDGEVGMSPASYSPFGVPFEIVVFFKEGVEELKPYMKNGKAFTSNDL